MSENVVRLTRRPEAERVLTDRLIDLRHELDEEMRARAVAEAAADYAQEFVVELQRRVATLEVGVLARDRLIRARLLERAWPFALAGLVGGFAAVLLLRAAGLS